MKKLLTVSFVIVFAVAIQASASDKTKALSDKANLSFNQLSDTIPTDTTKKDTTFSSAVAYRMAADTIPSDTTKKDTSFQSFAYNR